MSEDLNTLYDGQDFPQNEQPLDTQQSPVGHNRKLATKTIEQYQYFVKVLRQSLLKASPPNTLQEDIQPSELVDHLYDRAIKGELRPRTFMSYRSGLLYWLNTIPQTAEAHMARLRLQVGVPRTGYKSHKPKGEPV